MIKYILIGFGLLFATRAYANNLRKIREKSKVKVLSRIQELDNITE
jgi:hypothetical protein